ncbi:MAG: flippase-like domain-containing protein [Treponema sp.]|jgi:uncharacterized protein (TIRG00374 family)|nr:flippase-like domain-containing protein [Treponema sp.]
MKKLQIVLKILVSIALVAILVVTANIREIVSTVSRFNIIWLGPVFFFIILAVIISVFKWKALLKAQGIAVSVLKLFRYYTAGFFFNNFLPSSLGCDGVRTLLLKNEFNSYAGAASSVAAERILATASLGFLGLVGALFASSPQPPAAAALGIIFAVGVLLTALLLTGFIPKKLVEKQSKFATGWKDFAGASADLRRQPLSLVVCFVESIAFQMAVALSQEAIILGLGLPPLGLGDLFFASAASSAIAMIPLGVNGYGFREGGFIYLLGPLGYSSSAAFSVSILFAFFVAVYSLSGAFFWIRERPARRNKTTGAQA